ncbi:MAG TPA: protein kinase [Bryobacteraceae bacterium]|nr:protein kinase [Bryobacteraceae bacterium]
MTPERWAQIRRIFEAAVERPARKRNAWVERACGDDAELHREVIALLASHDGAGAFLEQPAAEVNRVLISSTSVSVSSPIESVEYPGGFQVGGYQLQKCIARGGMGSVWLATRPGADPAERFAIKMVKRGMDTREILRRFRTERQVLASLDHPNIARLLDAGSTPEGLPYLVMEFVEGKRIDHYCESKKSSITERLTLFRQVCLAVQYAHQKLVVHRDLKPGNILVTPEGVPKLLDFGIAKLLAGPAESDATETRPEWRAMTIEYASPEQVRGDPVTTSTDVYSLGVTLFRLLTAKLPYGSGLHGSDAWRQAVCEREPLRASAVILVDSQTAVPDATQKLEAATESRERARRRLRKKLAGDLDSILLMALRKEPERRYASVEQFSEDLRRYLEGRPVMARGGAYGYRIGKFLRRHVAGVVIATLLVVALAIVAGVASYYEREAARRERAARMEQESLQQELLRTYLRSPDLDGRRRALEIAQTIQRADPGRLTARQDLLIAAQRLGAAHAEAGDRLAALSNFSLALQMADSLPAADPAARRCHAACNLFVGEILAASGEREAAVVKLRKAFEGYRSLTGLDAAIRIATLQTLEQALADLARKAPADLRVEIEGVLQRFRRGGDK